MYVPNTMFHKIKSYFALLPDFTFVCCPDSRWRNHIICMIFIFLTLYCFGFPRVCTLKINVMYIESRIATIPPRIPFFLCGKFGQLLSDISFMSPLMPWPLFM